MKKQLSACIWVDGRLKQSKKQMNYLISIKKAVLVEQ